LRSSPSELPREFAEAVDRARPRLGGLASELLFYSSIGSTNDVAAQLASDGDHEGAVVVADAQTAGRGRRGRTWFSPAGSGLYVSVVLAPRRARVSPARAVTLTTLAAGVALSEAVEAVTGLSTHIKWPNDLLVGSRKLAGILAEGITNEAVILGYGINVSGAAYPPELAGRVTALESELGRGIDRAAVFAETLAAVAARYGDLLSGRFDAILDAWRTRAPASRGTLVSWETTTGRRAGVTAGIDDLGALLVHTGDGIERIVAGEVTWI
jgi:BirA family biotin operon repressor/biotin-[acetyl-CoA-carboxylase] ligase